MKFFLYLFAPLFALLFISDKGSADHRTPAVSCGPATGYVFRATISSVQSGNWSDPATWGGRVPAAGDAVTISQGNTVFADTDASVAGIQVNGALWYTPSKSITVTSTQNILVTGLLQMTPADPAFVHTLRFAGINENNFVGGGMDPVATDVGLWVMGAGRLQLQGADKADWTNVVGSIENGVRLINLKDVTGWQSGDEVIVTATSPGASNYDLRNIAGIDRQANIVQVSTNLTAHPVINNMWTAEVGNLTRNVRIEGTVTGKSHIFIRSTQQQVIKNVAFRYLGPRKDQNGDKITDLILGRYGIHFHHCMDGSEGSVVEGCVMRDIGNHAYVPHVSNGITMTDNIAYNCTETPFWWDLPDATHRTVWTHNLVIQPNYVFHALQFDTPNTLALGTHAFVLGLGDDNRCDSNVVAGQQGLASVSAAYDWEEMPTESAWTFKGNAVHNSDCGIRSWQNNGKNHVLENITVYNCGVGVLHGAYVNNYTYQSGILYNAVFEDHAASDINGVRIENMTLDGAGLIDYPFHIVPEGAAAGVRPLFIRASTLKGGKKGALLDEAQENIHSVDLIQCNITGALVLGSKAKTGETIRVQPASGQPYQITKSGQTNIAAFAPTSWGTGTGLLGQYYNNTDFTDLAETRIDPLINFPEWQLPLPGLKTGVHYRINDQSYSIRFAGYIEAQYSEAYRFSVLSGGAIRLWINGVQMLNYPEGYPSTFSTVNYQLAAGKRVPIRIEYVNTDDKSSLYLYWQSASQKKQLVPQTQLYQSL